MTRIESGGAAAAFVRAGGLLPGQSSLTRFLDGKRSGNVDDSSSDSLEMLYAGLAPDLFFAFLYEVASKARDSDKLASGPAPDEATEWKFPQELTVGQSGLSPVRMAASFSVFTDKNERVTSGTMSTEITIGGKRVMGGVAARFFYTYEPGDESPPLPLTGTYESFMPPSYGKEYILAQTVTTRRVSSRFLEKSGISDKAVISELTNGLFLKDWRENNTGRRVARLDKSSVPLWLGLGGGVLLAVAFIASRRRGRVQ